MMPQHAVGIVMPPVGDALQVRFESCADGQAFCALDAGALW